MKPHAINGTQFENLLARLSADRDQAGVRYEQLRRRLISLFRYRGCASPEELADETLDRAARKLEDSSPVPEQGDPAPFVFGIAWNVARESFHRTRPVTLPEGCEMIDPAPAVDDQSETTRKEHCLDTCLQRLAAPDRSLLLTYFQLEKRAKIEQRSLLAAQLRISPNALRLRVHRMTASLRDCTYDCAGADRAS